MKLIKVFEFNCEEESHCEVAINPRKIMYLRPVWIDGASCEGTKIYFTNGETMISLYTLEMWGEVLREVSE